MKKMFLGFVTFCFICTSNVFGASKFAILSDSFPPFNFTDKGKDVGINVDILLNILNMSGFPTKREDIVRDTWSSNFAQAITSSNAILLSVPRIPERENILNWIGPVVKSKVILMAKASKNVKINSSEDMKKYKIATLKNLASEKAFVASGGDLKKAIRVTKPRQAFKMLELGRVDCIAITDIVFKYWLSKSSSKPTDFKEVKLLEPTDIYIATSKQVPMDTINKLQSAFDSLKIKDSSGMSIYTKILSKYVK